jgi:hypothetical protein
MNDQVTTTMKWIEHNGKPILFADYSGVDMLELQNEVKVNERAIVELGSKGFKDLLVLTDVRGCHIDLAAVSAFQSVTTAMKPYTKGSAVVGISKLRKILLEAVNKFSKLETRAFDTLEEGKEWLVRL